MKKIIFFIVLIFLIGCNNSNSQQSERTIIPKEKELRTKANNYISYILKEDIQGILSLLHDKQAIATYPEVFHTKKEIVKDFKNKGKIYSFLFDSRSYNKVINFNKEVISIQEQLLRFKDKNFRIESIHILYETKKWASAQVLYTYDGKKKYPESYFYDTYFEYIDKKWYLTKLKLSDSIFVK